MKITERLSQDWQETHFEIVSEINIRLNSKAENNLVHKTQEAQGRGGLYELAERLTDRFQHKYRNANWGDGIDWLETIEEFMFNECDKKKR